jgi:hypothetical protein
MRFGLLGSVVVVDDSGQQMSLAGPRLRVLLAALLLDHAEQALGHSRASGNKNSQAAALNNVGWFRARLGDYQRATSTRPGMPGSRPWTSSMTCAVRTPNTSRPSLAR